MNPIKEALRKDCLVRRETLTEAYAQACNRAIFSRLIDLAALNRATLVHTYVSAKPHEVDTHTLIRYALANRQRIVVPVVRPKSLRMTHAQINALEQLRVGHFGLLQPAASHRAWLEDLTQLDLVLVPGLAFDRQGNRLGFGKGYYDRFLAGVTALKIGLAQQSQILDQVPHEPHDIRMDMIVTEEHTFHPKKQG